jgi:hypothetical protein
MRFQIDDRRGASDLVRFFRRRGYLAADVGDHVEIVAIESAGELADRARTLRDLGEWKAAHPEARVEPLEGPAPV